MKFIKAKGSPFEIGLTHGSLGRASIECSLKTYQELFFNYFHFTWSEAREKAGQYAEIIENYDPDYIEEMKGIAEGAEKDFEDILTLNVRSEILFPNIDGCTSIGLSRERTENGDVVIGQNWDWKQSQKDALLLLLIEQERKPTITMVTEGGIIGKIGLNSFGVGVCLNALATPVAPVGVPLHIVLRKILDSYSMGSAISAVSAEKMACSANFLIGCDGEIINLEVVPNDYDILYPQAGYLVHTNHFCSPRLFHLKDTGKLLFPDSHVRLGKTEKLVSKDRDEVLSTDTIKGILSDHTIYPDSICRHEDVNILKKNRFMTVFSIIMNVSRKELLIAHGPPCSNPYQSFRFIM